MEIDSSFMMADRVSWFATRLMKLDDCGGCNVVIGWAWCYFITNNGGPGGLPVSGVPFRKKHVGWTWWIHPSTHR